MPRRTHDRRKRRIRPQSSRADWTWLVEELEHRRYYPNHQDNRPAPKGNLHS